jgi:D-alanyl-D-alanine carboxypeptidase
MRSFRGPQLKIKIGPRPVTFVPTLRTSALVAALAATQFTILAPSRASAEALLLIEADSGRVLHAENATYPWYPASVTKVMTAYVALQAVKNRRLSLDTLLTVSARAASQAPSKMGFKAGTQVTLDNAIKMLMVKSANDIAVVIAEGVSGSVEKFSDEMNLVSKNLGMVQSSWVNPNGLPAENQISSARDLAILARATLHDFPEYEMYWNLPGIKLGKRVMKNYNTLIGRYPGADGMKTGFICASGFNLVATATRGSRRLIAVVLGSRSGMQRAEKAAQLLERGFTGGGGLSWLIPAFGTVNSLTAVDAAPPNLREDICGKGRRARPPSDSESEPVATAEPGSVLASMTSFQLGPRTQGSLIGALTPSMAPIPVYAGVPKPDGGMELASAPPSPRKKKAAPAAETAAAGPAQGATAPKGHREAHARTSAAAKSTSDKPATAESGAVAKQKPKPKPKPLAAKQ